ncbi:MAG: 16S rRNA (cytosine(1402)-N(4))-methyltransferase [Flavobacteriales bacterium]|nr:16S rRNA (cytosine(1402)-N(4))-methyltransferase [Flavobacteriales bacterium]|tara:strand:+ start:20922 stop:21833 length:912 start_codon:yes stop_codon:yes gene_type:complete
MVYHNPVLLQECIDGLNIKPEGIYVDTTFGGGGHSRLIMSKLSHGRLFAFDQDRDAANNDLKQAGFKLINANFRYLSNFLRMEGVEKIDGLLADLGVSSYQFDIPERGFSTRFTGKLDMRMNRDADLSAIEVINNYSEESLASILFRYGDLNNSRRISREIVRARSISPIRTTTQLIAVINEIVHEKHRNQFLARVFQAIRIEVNDEISALQEMLLSAIDMLNPDGRLVVLSYHSLEDRLVKNLMKKGNFDGLVKKDFFGNQIKKLKEINKKVIIASKKEVKDNSRARSAKLRVAEKINENKN